MAHPAPKLHECRPKNPKKCEHFLRHVRISISPPKCGPILTKQKVKCSGPRGVQSTLANLGIRPPWGHTSQKTAKDVIFGAPWTKQEVEIWRQPKISTF